MEEQERRPIGGKRLAPEDRGSLEQLGLSDRYRRGDRGAVQGDLPAELGALRVHGDHHSRAHPADSWQLPYMVSDPTPERGDIVTFWSDELNKLLVKRVVGLPGGRHRVPGRLYLCQR